MKLHIGWLKWQEQCCADPSWPIADVAKVSGRFAFHCSIAARDRPALTSGPSAECLVGNDDAALRQQLLDQAKGPVLI